MLIANLDRKNRLITMFIHIIKLQHAQAPSGPVFHFGVYEVFCFSLYFNKDIFLGRSVAKRTLGFQVLNNNTGLPAGPLRCLVRNFTVLLWPIEVVVALVNVNRRIGDHLAGTRLEVYDPKLAVRPEWGAIVVCFLLAAAVTYVFWFWPVELFLNYFLAYQV